MLQKNIFALLVLVLLASCSPTQRIQVKTVEKTIRDTVYIKEISKVEDRVYQAAVLKNYNVNADSLPSIGQDYRVKFLILHYTALDYPTSMRVLTKQAVSSHYLINDKDDKEIDILVSEDARAWHAGVSFWGGRVNLNDSSIGIEIVNQGSTECDGKKCFFAYPDYQIKKVAALAKNIIERYEIAPDYVLGHSDVAPQRKNDPGPLFPWEKLYRDYQIGAWYEEYDKQFYEAQFLPELLNDSIFIKTVQEDFARYGYEIEANGEWTKKSKRVVSAFQMHFRPANYDGVLDRETWAILKALIKKYKTKI